MIRNRIAALIAVGALAMIGVGASLIYLPAGFIAVGLLIWLDLSLAGGGGKKK